MNTKRMLFDAFYELMHERDFDDITVQMILDRAQLSRGTFYRHYSDKYDLMNSFYRNYAEGLLRQVGKTASITEVFELVFQHLQQNKDYYRKSLKTEGMESFVSFLVEYSFDFYMSIMKEAYAEDLDPKSSIRIEMLCAAHIFATKRWLERDCLESPEQMARLCYEFLPEDLKNALLSVSR